MQFERRFTKDGQDAYAGISFASRTAKYGRGTTATVTVPETWSQVATDIIAEKYMRKAGIPQSLPAKVSEPGVPVWLCPTPAAGPSVPTGGETDARQVFDRLAGFWAYWGWKLGYFRCDRFDYRQSADRGPQRVAAERSARIFYDELRYMLAAQMAAPASPQWFNAGLNWAYGISGDDCGQWCINFDGIRDGVNPDEQAAGLDVLPSSDPYTRPALSACFIQSIKDNLVEAGGIQDLMRREALVFKYGGGSGTNWSPVRGEGEPLSGGGVSSGLLSFLKAPDYSAGAIKSGGTTRRAARMLCLNDNHPELLAFIGWKPNEEKKVAAMAAGSKLVAREVRRVYEAAADYRDAPNDDAHARTVEMRKRLKRRRRQAVEMGVPKSMVDAAAIAGGSGDPMPTIPDLAPTFEGAAYETVCGQNANNSIRVTNAFMAKAVTESSRGVKDWPLYGRVELRKAKKEGREPKPHATVDASDTLDKMAYAAWECGCPGWQYDTTVNEWWTCPKDGPVNASNPCCLVGETLVDTSEGLIPIASLVNQFAAGRELPYAFARDTGSERPTLRRIKRAWKAGEVVRLIRVTTDKGIEVTATPEHRFLTFAGGWVRADRLTVGSSLRKIARHTNDERSGRVSISDRGCGNANGTAYLNRWMWEQANGPIPDGFDVHHKNDDPTDDRLSNFELRELHEHRSEHSSGSDNPRFIDATDDDLLRVWDKLNTKPDKLTAGRWNACVRKLNLVGRVPLAFTGDNPRIRGVIWPLFVEEMRQLRAKANDRVVKVEVLTYAKPVPVYDIEIEGVHNFAVTSDPRRGRHTIVVHNSEYMAADDTACNLASLNALKFLSGGVFDCAAYEHAARLWTTVLDITVSAAGYPSEEIAEGSRKYRTLGLGYANAGALLMRQGIPYDSHAGRAWCGYLTALMHYTAAATSAELAGELGAFPRYADNAADVQRVFENHANFGAEWGDVSLYQGLTFTPVPLRHTAGAKAVPQAIRDRVELMVEVMLAAVKNKGLRNAQLTLLAPTGTIGLLMDCDTTGIEPDFALVKFKKLAGGGYVKIVNQSVPPAMLALGYTAEEAEAVRMWVVGRGRLLGADMNEFIAGGSTKETVEMANAAVPGAMKLADCFEPWVIGEDEYKRAGVPPYDAKGRPNGAAYVAKFVSPEIAQRVSYDACGHLTVEGCPVLRAEHLPVFDCANRCGFDGKRFLSVSSHLQMMSAVQPVLSGAISKTVNFPGDATPSDFREAAVEAWKLSLKAMAGYRDGSKMSQPLNTDSGDGDDEAEESGEAETPKPILTDDQRGKLVADLKEHYRAAPPVLTRGQRRKLPNRVKSGDRVKFGIVGSSAKHKFYLRCGNYPEGDLAEIFIDCNKEGATLRGIMNTLAKAVSIGLQFGVPLDAFVDAFVGTKFEPNGPIQGHDRLRRCDSIIDGVFRELAIQYLKRDDLAHVPAEVQPADAVAVKVSDFPITQVLADIEKMMTKAGVSHTPEVRANAEQMQARAKGYTGDQCPNQYCKAFTLVRAGNCMKCESCGEQSGCV